MARYTLRTLQNTLVDLAAFRTGQCGVLPEQTVDLLKEATRLTIMARTVLQISSTTRDRFERVAQAIEDDIVRRATWDVAEQVGVDETLRTSEDFVSRLCDVLAARSFGRRPQTGH